MADQETDVESEASLWHRRKVFLFVGFLVLCAVAMVSDKRWDEAALAAVTAVVYFVRGMREKW
jgi:hypothetical protein